MSDDRWERLWTPHRIKYIRGEGKPTHSDAGADCPFCAAPELDDETGLIVARGETVFAVMNLFPYTSGHLMVCPYRHVADYTELNPAEVAELGAFTQTAMNALRVCARAQGFNVGMNQGGIAGAGIAAHLHQHVVPRWGGDTNFMPVIGGTKTMPQLIEEARELIVEAWGSSPQPLA